MHPIPLESSLLASAAYDGHRQVLDVGLRSGERYRYFNVPSACYQELMEADSKGVYFNQHIRNRFPYQRLSAPGSAIVLGSTKTK